MNTDLLRPPAHRGPLIAAGAVVLAVGVVLEELRLSDKLPIGVHVLITATAAAVILGIGLQAPTEGGRPRAYQSVLLVTGLLLLYLALLRLADALGATYGGGGDSLVWANLPPGAIMWTSLVLAGAAGWAALSRRSAVSLLIAALATGLALLAALAWITGADSQGPYRFLLLVLAIALVLGSLVLRGGEPRHVRAADQRRRPRDPRHPARRARRRGAAGPQPVRRHARPPAAGLLGAGRCSAAGCGLIAFGAVDRAPGAAYLGFANLRGVHRRRGDLRPTTRCCGGRCC